MIRSLLSAALLFVAASAEECPLEHQHSTPYQISIELDTADAVCSEQTAVLLTSLINGESEIQGVTAIPEARFATQSCQEPVTTTTNVGGENTASVPGTRNLQLSGIILHRGGGSCFWCYWEDCGIYYDGFDDDYCLAKYGHHGRKLSGFRKLLAVATGETTDPFEEEEALERMKTKFDNYKTTLEEKIRGAVYTAITETFDCLADLPEDNLVVSIEEIAEDALDTVCY